MVESCVLECVLSSVVCCSDQRLSVASGIIKRVVRLLGCDYTRFCIGQLNLVHSRQLEQHPGFACLPSRLIGRSLSRPAPAPLCMNSHVGNVALNYFSTRCLNCNPVLERASWMKHWCSMLASVCGRHSSPIVRIGPVQCTFSLLAVFAALVPYWNLIINFLSFLN